MAKQNIHQGPKATYKARPNMPLPPGMAKMYADQAKGGFGEVVMSGKSKTWVFPGTGKQTIVIVSLDPPAGHIKS